MRPLGHHWRRKPCRHNCRIMEWLIGHGLERRVWVSYRCRVSRRVQWSRGYMESWSTYKDRSHEQEHPTRLSITEHCPLAARIDELTQLRLADASVEGLESARLLLRRCEMGLGLRVLRQGRAHRRMWPVGEVLRLVSVCEPLWWSATTSRRRHIRGVVEGHMREVVDVVQR